MPTFATNVKTLQIIANYKVMYAASSQKKLEDIQKGREKNSPPYSYKGGEFANAKFCKQCQI